MTYREQLARQVEDFLQCHRAEEHPNGRALLVRDHPSITISRQAGASGMEIASHLVDYLSQFDETAEHGWAFFDQSLLAHVIENRSLPDGPRECDSPATPVNAPHPVVDELNSTPASHWSLFQHSANLIRKLCHLGNVIILGRGGNFLTQDCSRAFHVRLVGDQKERAHRLASLLKLDLEEAQEHLESTDRARGAYIERHFGRKIDDPSSYHLTLNVTGLTPATTAHIIGDSMIEWAGSRSLPISA